MADHNGRRPSSPRRWAELRFAIIGPVLASPPPRGELGRTLEALSQQTWRHPTTGEPVRFGASTIERWLIRARKEPRDRVAVLARRVRKDRGGQPCMHEPVRLALSAQYADHPGWTMQLHYDNLVALAEKQPALRPLPSYSTVVRYMKAHDLVRRIRRGPPMSAGADLALERLQTREVRSWEVQYVNQLWHSDFHTSKRLPVLLEGGQWVYPVCACVLDDRARLCCHAQWYLAGTAETFVHSLGQAILKRGVPAAFMSDRGTPMRAEETTGGLRRLGVVHDLTLPYSPDQNGKQESFWGQLPRVHARSRMSTVNRSPRRRSTLAPSRRCVQVGRALPNSEIRHWARMHLSVRASPGTSTGSSRRSSSRAERSPSMARWTSESNHGAIALSPLLTVIRLIMLAASQQS
jgi:transposase InsO family protein